ncbi:hypothetical protein MCOR27_009632 [Pyricularia oryzae]|uniref:Zinc metalloprotease n=2 Tax=Pyricularia TaxID=48558 RepID=A0ABQ8NS55_PYRGI|nr:hypothetical protein MCOR01_004000 [Pyricularia oryzae]KAI6300341.1 hypothetical protein MCOR33_003914 [Pyricularia grisea]KAH9430635.1 hypothetical protein MCOR02_007970 [Pyricularia oryzae]KAI6258223.1 hypothetical protein MCOR19_005395 [Pyricularia oryzae]KAI6269698.1 hypothetical protein MCOR27_009632 [Pyricularia oryzae]
MRLLPSLVTTLLAISGYTDHASASSIRRNPLQTTNRLEDVHFSTAWQQVQWSSRFDATFRIKSGEVMKKIRLALEPNNDVISHETYIQTVDADGRPLYGQPIARDEYRIFRGTAFIARDTVAPDWRDAGWARIVVHSDGRTPLFEGVFSIDGDYHHVQTAANYLRTRLDQDPSVDDTKEPFMVVWRDSDLSDEADRDAELRKRGDEKRAVGCGVDFDHHLRVEAANETTNSEFVVRDLSEIESSSTSLFKRQSQNNGINTIGSTAGCPTTRRVALMGIATDCTYVKQFASVAEARANIMTQVASASALYEKSFNISLAVRNLTISESCAAAPFSTENRWNQDCNANLDVSDRLSAFSAFRGNLRNDRNAFWTLMSSCTSGSAVGIAWLGALCMPGTQTDSRGTTVAGANYVARTGNEWQVLAHEIGHTFGAEHDCISSTCSSTSGTGAQQCCPLSASQCDAQQRFIMNPSARSGITEFSRCTIGSVCSQLGVRPGSTRSLGRCLVDNTNVASVAPVCGNGVVESGEDCDSDNPCCDRSTCKFRSGASCDPATDTCCTSQCSIAPSGGVCRPSTLPCDPEEKCDGKSRTCPADVNNASDNGRCSDADNVGNAVGNFFSQNRNVAIGVGAGIGGLIVICLASCCLSSMRRRSAVRKQHRQMVAAQAAGAHGGYPRPNNGPMPPPPSYYAGSQPQMSGPWPQPPPRSLSARYA